jgi:transcriptional regulator GlxA family with amidase domain
MNHISIIVPVGKGTLSTVSCIASAFEVFETANNYWKQGGRKTSFRIESVGVSKKTEIYDSMFTVRPQVNITGIKRTDLIVIPPVVFKDKKYIQENQLLIDWIRQQYKNGAQVASLCSGAFMLASSGLLDGRNCSTHWAHADVFRAMFPGVNLKPELLITDENGIYTNGGAYSFLNLLIYLVEKYYDRQTAIYCSKVCQIEMDRNSQSAFTIFTGQKLHGDEMIMKAQAYIESKADEKISIEELSSRFSIGRRNFDRRFIKATGNTPIEYAQRVKIESAKKALETTRKTINEVMYEVGYSDVKAFREVFRKLTGMSPLQYRARYNKEAGGLQVV